MNDLLLPAIQKSTSQDLDPYYNLVSLHLKGDVNTGRNYNAFSDASSNNFRLTNSGDVRGSSFSPYGTSWSSYMAAASLTSNYNSKINVGANSFVVEMFVYITAYSTGALLWNLNISGSERGYNIEFGSTGAINISASTNGTTYTFSGTTTDVVPLNQWVHIVWTRDQSQGSNNTRLFFNGILKYVGTFTGTQANLSTLGPRLGFSAGSGYLSNVRLINGSIPTDYQTSSTTLNAQIFQVPTSPLTAVTNTAFLGLQSNRFIDNSSTPLTLSTNTGSPTISSFSPFLETDTTSGSGYYDGAGDGLAISTAQANLGFGTGDFSTEFWAYRTNSNSFIVVFQLNTYNTGLYVRTESTTYNDSFYFVNNSYNWDPATNFPANRWTHICITRQSSTLRFFVNGKLIINATNTANMGAATADIGPAGYAGYLSDVRVVKGSVPVEYQTSVTTVGTQVFTPPTSLRTAVTNTQLLTLQERGAYNTIGFQDESEYQHIITRSGNVAQGTFSPFSNSGWSNLFNGSNAYLSLTATSAVQLSNSTAFAIEFWVYPASIPSVGGSAFILRAYNISSPFQGYGIAFGGNTLNTNLQIWNGTAWVDIGAVSANTWTHIAVTYEGSGSTLRYFINGQQQGSATTVPSSINYTGTPFIIGARNSDFYLNGYISNLRIVKGSAVYTGNFIPSTTPLTAITNTSLLTCQSNRFLDNSTNNFTITGTGSPFVQAFSPFKPPAYDPQVHGGSGYFDANGDFLQIPANAAFAFGTGAFTVEFWIYPTVAQTVTPLSSNYNYSSASGNWSFYFSTSGATTLYFNAGSASGSANHASSTTVSIPNNAWTHMAYTRTGSTGYFWINGVQLGTGVTDSSNYAGSSGDLYVGRQNDGTGQLGGYLAGLRIVKGTAVYTAAFTPPSGPLPILPNTSLLLNFTNAGVIDSTGKNVFETVGNAGVVTTTIKKYGSGSMFFDGTGDYLFASPSQNFSFGTGDFTIEAWFYTAVGTNNAIFQISNTAGGFHTNYTNTIAIGLLSGKLNLFGVAGTGITSTGASYATSSWVHVALVRSSGVTKLYLNGTLDTTVGTSGSITDTTNYTMQYIIVGGYFSTSYLWNGYIDDLRITRGLARYTANFTAPTKAHPDRGTASTLTVDMAAPSSVEALVVAGGASGAKSGNGGSPGGGAGGYIEHPSFAVSNGTSYNITIGAGGAGSAPAAGTFSSNDGNQTLFGSLTAIGGGGSNKQSGNTFIASGRNGGSGGGTGNISSGSGAAGSGTQPSQPGASGTYGFGNSGAQPTGGGDLGGGGGGAGGAAPGVNSGNGGAGKASSITGISRFYAGGGGSGAYGSGAVAGAGGSAIGGDGVANGSASAASGGSGSKDGAANTGSGGGGSWSDVGGSGSGGSGVVILAYPTSFRPLKASLGLVYTIDTVTRPGYRVYKFTAGTGTISW